MDSRTAVVERQLRARIAGQDHAIQSLVDTVTVLQSGLGRPGRPLVSMLFVGPTGVGKTETARALAATLRSGPDDYCRVDMSGFAQEHYVASISGAPPGYAGSREGHTVFDAARIESTPGVPGIVLFDEVEKAHPTVLRSLLHILDNGLLRLASGTRELDFRNCIVILTANLGVREAERTHRRTFRRFRELARDLRNGQLARGSDDVASLAGQLSYPPGMAGAELGVYARSVTRFFDPEFLNRLDHVILFDRVDRTTAATVAAREVHAYVDQAQQRGIRIDVRPEVIDHLTDLGFNPTYGIRALHRTLRSELTLPIARFLEAADDSAPGQPRTIEVALVDGEVHCRQATPADLPPRQPPFPDPTRDTKRRTHNDHPTPDH